MRPETAQLSGAVVVRLTARAEQGAHVGRYRSGRADVRPDRVVPDSSRPTRRPPEQHSSALGIGLGPIMPARAPCFGPNLVLESAIPTSPSRPPRMCPRRAPSLAASPPPMLDAAIPIGSRPTD
jgi:hypothetical protein